ncbi:MAG: Na+/H+ antiporter subunit B [Acidobacteriota bacterium]|jgi:multicomponent Na+:H+ antiporter subunit B|nr:MAG: Na+/H+ antiporter subunit B [Acidobacteriota bacterium]
MSPLILRTATRVLMPLMVLFALFMLVRGHNDPGGGFVGGLVVSAAYALLAFTSGVAEARRALIVDPERLLGVGLLVALFTGLSSALAGEPFLTALWWGGLGSPLFFDIGVFLVVIGVVLTMTFTLAED